jgi:hypothetical protein
MKVDIRTTTVELPYMSFQFAKFHYVLPLCHTEIQVPRLLNPSGNHIYHVL